MGFRALLSDGTTIAPAVEVLSRELTPQQANKMYRRTTGTCPHCQALRDSRIGTDNAHIQAALSIADLSVHYVSAAIEQERMTRIMHFAHRRGFLQTDGACLLCRNVDLAHHAAVVQVIGRWAERHWNGHTVTSEMTVVLPGTPPQQFRPDVCIHDAAGQPVACIEYQRTPERFVDFKLRHELRCRQFPAVLWFFARGAYVRSSNHRAYLHDRDHDFYKCWVDDENAGLVYEPGKPPGARKRPRIEHRLDECSEATLIQALERSTDAPVAKVPEARLDTRRDMAMANQARQLKAPAQITTPTRRTTPTTTTIKTVTERVQAALDAGCRTAGEVTAWDAAQGRGSLHHTEASRTLRRLGA